MTHGEILPDDTQATLAEGNTAAREHLLTKAGIDFERFKYESYLARAAFNAAGRSRPRCALSHNGYGCKLGATHDGDVHRGADGHEWRTDESWGVEGE